MQIRQGDLLFEKIVDKPNGLFKKSNENIIEYGEETGHAHALTNPESAELMVSIDRELVEYINVLTPAVVGHNTHKSVTLTPGNWAVIRQRTLNLRESREYGVINYVRD